MKITEVETIHLRLPTIEEECNGTQDALLVKIDLVDGQVQVHRQLGMLLKEIGQARCNACRAQHQRCGDAQVTRGLVMQVRDFGRSLVQRKESSCAMVIKQLPGFRHHQAAGIADE